MAPRFWSVGLVVPFVEMGMTEGGEGGVRGRLEMKSCVLDLFG